MKQKPKVLMVGTEMTAKGGVSSVLRLYREAGLFESVQLMASYRDGSALQKVIHYLFFLAKFITTLMTQPQLRIVHVHMSSYGSFFRKSWVILLSRAWGRPVIIHMHGAGFIQFYERMPALGRWFIRTVLRASTVLIALSSQWRDDLFSLCQHPDIWVLYNPTVLKQPVFELANQVDEHSITNGGDGGQVKFLFMGRLGQRKGVYDIISAMRSLSNLPIQVDLYGDGELESIQREIVAAGVHEKVTVHGWVDGAHKDIIFREADALLLPSYHEGLPISVLEAMAYGLPVVATDVGGIAEAVEDGLNGYLIRPGAFEALSLRMAQLAESAVLRQEMGKAGYQLAARKFDLPVIVKQLEALYEEIIGR